MPADEATYLVPRGIQKDPHSVIFLWAIRQHRENYGKYAMYKTGQSPYRASYITPHIEIVPDYFKGHIKYDPNDVTLRVVFEKTRVLSWLEYTMLIKDLKEEPADELILIRAKNPALAVTIDEILKGVI